MPEQRRHYSRIAFDSPAQLLFAEQQFEVRILDLSLHGALVRLPEHAQPGLATAAQLRLVLDDAGNQICMQTTVAHHEGRRAGLSCQSIDVDSVTHLRRLVDLNAGDADLLQRELSALLSA